MQRRPPEPLGDRAIIVDESDADDTGASVTRGWDVNGASGGQQNSTTFTAGITCPGNA